MYILIYFLVLSLVTYLNNLMQKVDIDNSDGFTFDATGRWIIFGTFCLSIVMQITFKYFLKDMRVQGLFISAVVYFITLYTANILRIQYVKDKRDQIRQVYEILQNLFVHSRKISTEGDLEIDYNNIPFELKFHKGEISEIVVNIVNANLVTDNTCTQSMYSLNKFLPKKNWVYSIDYPNKTCKFVGKNHPPTKAPYPGSDLRPWNWIPLAVSAEGELGWNLGAKDGNMGRSLFEFVDEEGNRTPARTVKVSKAPQGMCLGSTGGGKAIKLTQKIYRKEDK